MQEADGLALPTPVDKAQEPDGVRALLKAVDAMLIDARQLVDGWWQTTPTEEWSEWDEATRKQMADVHKRVFDALYDAGYNPRVNSLALENEQVQRDSVRALDPRRTWALTPEGMRTAPPAVLFGYAYAAGFQDCFEAARRANAVNQQPVPTPDESAKT